MAFTIPNNLLEHRRERAAAYCQSYKAILTACAAEGDPVTGLSPDYLKAVERFRRAAEELEIASEAIRRFPITEYWRLEKEIKAKKALALERGRSEVA